VKLEFCGQSFEKPSNTKNFMKTHPEGADLFHADRRTDMTKLVVAFRNFANAPKKMTDSYSGCSVGSIAILTDITGVGEVGGGGRCVLFNDGISC
jgi:hypothetical protein